MRLIFIALLATSLIAQAEEDSSSDSNKLKGLLGGLLKKIDKDGDGKLNDSEKEAIHGKVKKEVLKRFDKDGDGKLNAEEKAAAKAEAQQRVSSDGEESSAIERKARAEFNKRFDKDGDGKLNEAEKKAALDAAKKLREKVDPKAKPAPAAPAPAEVKSSN